jgi:hypothetical protein
LDPFEEKINLAKTFIDTLRTVATAVCLPLVVAVTSYVAFIEFVQYCRKVGVQFPEATLETVGGWAQNLGALVGCWFLFNVDGFLHSDKYAISAVAGGAGVASFIATANFLHLVEIQGVPETAETLLFRSAISLAVGIVVGIRTRRRLINQRLGAAAMREKFASELKAAMKAGDKRRVGTIRVIMAALKDKETKAREHRETISGEDILALLQEMVKSRKELQEIYEKAGQGVLATQESEEIAIIEGFLPPQISEAGVAEAIAAAIAETKASSTRTSEK